MRRDDSVLLARRIVSAVVPQEIFSTFEALCREKGLDRYDVIRGYMQRCVSGEFQDLKFDLAAFGGQSRKFTFYESRSKATAFFRVCYQLETTVSDLIVAMMIQFLLDQSKD